MGNHEKSPGLKAGGVLNIVRHEVEVHCPADAIPEFFIVAIVAPAAGLAEDEAEGGEETTA